MAYKKAVKQIDLKNMPSDQITELAEAVLIALINNSKMKDTLKKVLTEIIRELENSINPDGTTTPTTPTTPTVKDKGLFGKILNYVLTIASFILPFILKGKGITLRK